MYLKIIIIIIKINNVVIGSMCVKKQLKFKNRVCRQNGTTVLEKLIFGSQNHSKIEFF